MLHSKLIHWDCVMDKWYLKRDGEREREEKTKIRWIPALIEQTSFKTIALMHEMNPFQFTQWHTMLQVCWKLFLWSVSLGNCYQHVDSTCCWFLFLILIFLTQKLLVAATALFHNFFKLKFMIFEKGRKKQHHTFFRHESDSIINLVKNKRTCLTQKTNTKWCNVMLDQKMLMRCKRSMATQHSKMHINNSTSKYVIDEKGKKVYNNNNGLDSVSVRHRVASRCFRLEQDNRNCFGIDSEDGHRKAFEFEVGSFIKTLQMHKHPVRVYKKNVFFSLGFQTNKRTEHKKSLYPP